MKPSEILVVAFCLCLLPLASAVIGCSGSNSGQVSNGNTAQTGTDGFTLTADVATSYYANAHVTLTLTVPSTGDPWTAVQLAVRRTSDSKMEGAWDLTKSIIVSTGLVTPTHLFCNASNQYQLVSGATTPTFTTAKGTAKFVWIAPSSTTNGNVIFTAAVAIDAATWFSVTGPTLPYLAQQGKCINPKTGNLTWSPVPICNGHGVCQLNNTCICNGTYTGAGCYINTACGSGLTGSPGHCTACTAGTYKPGYGAATLNETDYDYVLSELNYASPYGLITSGFIFQNIPTQVFVHGKVYSGDNVLTHVFNNGTVSASTVASSLVVQGNANSATYFAGLPSTGIAAALGGTSPVPGVYSVTGSSSGFTLTGTLTLHGPAGSSWIFQTSTLTVAVGAKIVTTGGANACNVVFRSSGAVTIGNDSTLVGTFSSSGAVGIGSNVFITGRVFSLTHITFTAKSRSTTIVVPTCPTGALSYDTTLCTRCSSTFGAVPMGLAGKYGILSRGAITVGTSTTLSGDMGGGRLPTLSNVNQVSGITHAVLDADSVAALANATSTIASMLMTRCTFIPDGVLGSITLKPGNYCYDANLLVTGPIVFDGQNNPLSVWRFICTGHINFASIGVLTATSSSQYSYVTADDDVLVNGALNSNIYWIAGSETTAVDVAADSTVNGNILAVGIINLGNNVHVTGSVVSTTGAINVGTTCTIGDIAVPQHYVNPARFTSPVGAIAYNNCSVSGTVCAAGRYYLAGSCPMCSVGTYKSITGDQPCSLCDAFHTTPSTGSTSAAQCSLALCKPGTTGPNGGTCTNCTFATYKSTWGPAACTACPVGFNTTAKGRASADTCSVAVACPPGYVGATGPCSACALGTYNNRTGSALPCYTCPLGKYATTTAATSIAQCLTVTSPLDGGDLCSEFHFKQDLCNRFDIEGCVFNTTTGSCIAQNCTFYNAYHFGSSGTAQQQCNFVRYCRWYDSKCNDYVPSSSSAFKVCDAIDGSYASASVLGLDTYAAACGAEPECEYLCATNHCVVDRNIIATTPDVNRAQCIQDGIGVWVQQTADCVDPFNSGHTFTSFDDPAFGNFTCPPGVCVVKGRNDPETFCSYNNADSCNALVACTWSTSIGRCLASPNVVTYDLGCDFCAYRTAYLQNYFNVEVPTIGAQTCVAPDCVQATDCPLKPHCKKHVADCIPDDKYLCPKLTTIHECLSGIGAGICQTYNATCVCDSLLNPPVGWATCTPGRLASSSSASVEAYLPATYIPNHLNFIVQLHGFSYNPTTARLTFYADTPLNWNPKNPQGVVIKVGYGGYPGLGYDFDLATIAGVTSAPTVAGSNTFDFAAFVTYIVANMNLPPVCTSSCGTGLVQDAFDALNPTGIASSVVILPDPYKGPILRFALGVDISTIVTAGTNAGVTGTYTAPGSLHPNGFLAYTQVQIPLTTLWRGPSGTSIYTDNLIVTVNGEGTANVAFTGQLGYGVTSTVLRTTFTAVGCSVSGQVRENIVLNIRYTSHNPNQLWLGPLHIQDLTLLSNCYGATLGTFATPVCASGNCDSQVTITSQCRTPTASGDTFTTCPSTYDAVFDGRFQISVAPWFCEATAQKTKNSCSGQTLLQGLSHDLVTAEVLLGTTNNTNINGPGSLVLTAGVLPLETSPLSDLVTQVNSSSHTSQRYTPVVVFFTNSAFLTGFTLQIDNALTLVTVIDGSGTVLATPTLATLSTGGSLSVKTKAFATATNPITHCAAVTGCDNFEIDALGLIAAYPTIASLNISFIVEGAPDGTVIPASRRLLSYDEVVVYGSNITIVFGAGAFANSGSSPKLNGGQIAGIVIGSFFGFVLIVLFLVWICWMSATPELKGYGMASQRPLPTYASSGYSQRGAALE